MTDRVTRDLETLEGRLGKWGVDVSPISAAIKRIADLRELIVERDLVPTYSSPDDIAAFYDKWDRETQAYGVEFSPASAIEARRAETQGGSVADESAVAESETPKDTHP